MTQMTQMHDSLELSVPELFDHKLDCAFDYVRKTRGCGALSDSRFVRFGVGRVLGNHKSGRQFLQYLKQCTTEDVPRATLYDAFQSNRRQGMVEEVDQQLERIIGMTMREAGVDFLRDFKELDGYRVLAGDGHNIAHSSHAKKDHKGNDQPANTIYLQDLRTGLTRPFAPVSGDGQRRHEMPVFRRTLKDREEQYGEGAGTIFVLDRAYIDGAFWKPNWDRERKKVNRHVITRTKENMTPTCCGEIPFDREDPVNTGVTSVWAAGFSAACGLMYVVEFTDPETQEPYSFLTTLCPDGKTIRPGTIAYLYFLRWRIEKTFDTFKNDFNEAKAWAGGVSARVMHSCFISMAYNLTRLILVTLEHTHGLTDRKVERKYHNELDRRKKKAEAAGRYVHPLHDTLPRMPKLSAQFLRTIENHIWSTSSILALIPVFSEALLGYI